MAHSAPRALMLALVLATGCVDCRRRGDECRTSADCPTDGLFCTAPPLCSDGLCVLGRPTCGIDEVCVEGTDSCVPCPLTGCADDGGLPDGSVLACEEAVSGVACLGPGGACASTCQPEASFEYVDTVRRDGTTGRPMPMRVFPGGYCAVGCDATRLNDECGDCADCNGGALFGSVRASLYDTMGYGPYDGVCRETCTPSTTGTGCPREGYSCDLETGTCMEACIDDRQCQIALEDTDGDGALEFVDRGADHPAYCDRTTGRCRTHGSPGASIGDRCTTDAQCPEDGTCLRRPGETSGLCTRLGCRAAGFECEDGSVCDVRNAGRGRSGCFLPCRVGAEDGTSAVRGAATGGSPDCGPGLACVWNGVAERGDAAQGSCVAGTYTDVTTPNVGAPCTSDAQCDSPFGYGVCLFRTTSGIGTGICSVQSCATFESGGEVVDGLLPGVAVTSPICDATRGEVCVNLAAGDEPPETYCLERCESASTCAPGYACTQILATPIRFCWPACYDGADCRPGAQCESSPGVACTAFDAYCTCSDGASP